MTADPDDRWEAVVATGAAERPGLIWITKNGVPRTGSWEEPEGRYMHVFFTAEVAMMVNDLIEGLGFLVTSEWHEDTPGSDCRFAILVPLT